MLGVVYVALKAHQGTGSEIGRSIIMLASVHRVL